MSDCEKNHLPSPSSCPPAGSELTKEELPAWQLPKLATSRHVAKTHSMKAINACEYNIVFMPYTVVLQFQMRK